jgi:hypothetical protein
MAKNYYRSGDNNLTCDVCGKKIKASESRLRWDGFQVCRDDWEERQPQDFVRARADKISVPVVRPQAPTPFNIPKGWQDLVHLTDAGTILSVLFSRNIQESVPVTDTFFQAAKLYRPVEILPVTEQVQITNTSVRDFFDALAVGETGAVCYLDYVDSTYFAEIYIGTCTIFPHGLYTDIITGIDTGFIIDNPYTSQDFFLETYVGAYVYFNP